MFDMIDYKPEGRGRSPRSLSCINTSPQGEGLNIQYHIINERVYVL